jgi:hypothetical protein
VDEGPFRHDDNGDCSSSLLKICVLLLPIDVLVTRIVEFAAHIQDGESESRNIFMGKSAGKETRNPSQNPYSFPA